MKYTIFILLVLCSSLLAQTQPPTPEPGSPESNQPDVRSTLYRADFRDPPDIFNNGFTPRGDNHSVFDHVRGASPYGQGLPRERQSAYVAATPYRNVAMAIARLINQARTQIGAGIDEEEGPVDIYIYEIRGTRSYHSVRPAFLTAAERYLDRDHLTPGQRYDMEALMRNEYLTEEWVSSHHVPGASIRRAWRVTFSSPRHIVTSANFDWADNSLITINTHYIDSATTTSSEILNEQGSSADDGVAQTAFWLDHWRHSLSLRFAACCCFTWKYQHNKSIDKRDDLPKFSEAYKKYCTNKGSKLQSSAVPTNFNGFKISYGKEITSKNINFGNSDKAWVDFNGDGKQDHCALGNSRVGKFAVLCAIQQESGNFIMKSFNLYDYGWPGYRYWIDVNGDNNVDFCRVVYISTHLFCSLSDGNKFYKDIDSGYINAGFWRSPADINGDGAVDFCRLLEEQRRVVFRCLLADPTKAKGFGRDIVYNDVGSGGSDYGDNSDNNRKWVDVDGDGKDDFCRFIQGQMFIRCNLMRSETTDGWVRVESLLLNFPGWSDQRWWIDYNGDGKTNFCRKFQAPYGKQIACLEIKTDFSGFDDSFRYDLGELFGPGEIDWVDLTGTNTKDICFLLPDTKKLSCQLYSSVIKKWADEYKTDAGLFLGRGNFNSGDTKVLANEDGTNFFCRKNFKGEMRCLEILMKTKCNSPHL